MRIVSVLLVAVFLFVALFLWISESGAPRPVSSAAGASVAPASAGLALEQHKLVTPAAAEEPEATRQVVDASAADPAPVAEITGPRCRIFGRAVDERANALLGVQVSMYSVGGAWSTKAKLPLVGEPGKGREVLAGTTAADGRFEFVAPLPTSDWVSISLTPGKYLALGSREFGPAGGRNQPRLVEGDNDLGDFVLAARGALAGSVRSADGASLEGANVSATANTDTGRVSNARVDSANRFVLEHLPAGKIEFGVKAEGWISAQNVPATVRVGETTGVEELVLTRATEISGIVVDQDGAPVAKVRVWGWPQASGQGAGATSKADGTFTLYLPQTEAYTLEVKRAKEFEPWGGQRGAPEFTFEPGKKDLRIVLTRAARITFLVVDAASRAPLENFAIGIEEKLAPGSFTSRFERGLEFTARPGGEASLSASATKHDVCVRASGYAPFVGAIVLDEGSKDRATIALSPASRLRGRLVRAGAPVTNATVTVQRETLDADGTPFVTVGASGGDLHTDVDEFTGRVRSLPPDKDGRFEFDELGPGTYALTAGGSTFAKKVWRALIVPAAGVLDLGDVELEVGAIVRGRLIAPDEASPIGYALRMGDDHKRRRVIDRADGTFEFAGLEAGKHVLTWHCPILTLGAFGVAQSHTLELVLGVGELRELTIDTREFGPATVRVRVLRGTRPAPGLQVRAELSLNDARNTWMTSENAMTDAEGWAVLELDGNTKLDLTVVASNPDVELGRLVDTVAVAGARNEHTITIRCGKLVLELPPALGQPEPDSMLRLSLTRPDQDRMWVNARSAGSRFAEPNAPMWSGRILELGEFPTGTFEVALAFDHTEPDPASANALKMVPLREPYTTSVTIEDGATARIVVP